MATSFFNVPDNGIREVVPFKPSFAQVFEFARHFDPDGFLSWMAAGADDIALEDLVEEYAASEAAKLEEYYACCEVWGSK